MPPPEPATTIVAAHQIGFHAGGHGHPILLLHGFPQTRLTWRSVAAGLAGRFRVICPDLPGYGHSDRLGDGPAGFKKSRMATHLVAFMRSLGHDRFAVVGHDRGGLVAFRLGLDHADAITHLGVLDILPTVDNWAALHGPAGVFAFHLFLLAQPNDLPERMITADPDTFFGHFLDTWTKQPDAIPATVREHYLGLARRPDAIHAAPCPADTSCPRNNPSRSPPRSSSYSGLTTMVVGAARWVVQVFWSSASRSRTRRSISSRMGRTWSSGFPAGSSSSQSR